MLHSLGAELQSFRPSARALAWVCWLPAVLVAPSALRRGVLEDAPVLAIAGALLLGALAALLAFLLLWPVLSFFKVHVHELGLRAYDAYGRTALVAWHEVHEVAPISMLGLAYVRIRTTGTSREVWLPRFLVDQQAFDRLVHDLAGRGHPLSRDLAENPGQGRLSL